MTWRYQFKHFLDFVGGPPPHEMYVFSRKFTVLGVARTENRQRISGWREWGGGPPIEFILSEVRGWVRGARGDRSPLALGGRATGSGSHGVPGTDLVGGIPPTQRQGDAGYWKTLCAQRKPRKHHANESGGE